jgi:hypothetical protein
MDHHCNWINNCVGRNNHLVFYFFLFSLFSYLIFLICLCSFNLSAKVSSQAHYHLLGFACSDSESILCPDWLIVSPILEGETAQVFMDFTLIEVITLTSLAIPCLMELVVRQTSYILKNTTTFLEMSKNHNKIIEDETHIEMFV